MRLKFKELEHVKTKKADQLFRSMLQGSGSAIPPERTSAMSRILSENIIVPYKMAKTTIAAMNDRGLSMLVLTSNWIVLRKFLCTCDQVLNLCVRYRRLFE